MAFALIGLYTRGIQPGTYIGGRTAVRPYTTPSKSFEAVTAASMNV